MDSATLAAVMGNRISSTQYRLACGPLNRAMILAEANTVQRAAVLLAQVKVESIGLYATQELGDYSYLSSHSYYPYIGRGYIQCTWEYNYADFGQYLHNRGQLSDPNYFVHNPEKLASRKYAALTVAWYWSKPHGWTWGTLNNAADHGDIVDASHQVNGGDNGLDERIAAYKYALSFGGRILPEGNNKLRTLAKLGKRVDSLEEDNKRLHARCDSLRSRQTHIGERVDNIETGLRKLQNGRPAPAKKATT